jgi:hypothetical protein
MPVRSPINAIGSIQLPSYSSLSYMDITPAAKRQNTVIRRLPATNPPVTLDSPFSMTVSSIGKTISKTPTSVKNSMMIRGNLRFKTIRRKNVRTAIKNRNTLWRPVISSDITAAQFYFKKPLYFTFDGPSGSPDN